ncbi:hypothetical protein F2Q69_00050264 [Brassica cretica]|uniref:Uncharacterized protein n=1 Tax=Brassica cretica TaxID=69181 RepID=A0A8S9PTU2_BRACR|nr:hypothetical protein F2Q69_00050264 [Brassica cretica]
MYSETKNRKGSVNFVLSLEEPTSGPARSVYVWPSSSTEGILTHDCQKSRVQHSVGGMIWRVGFGSLEKQGGGVDERFLWARGVVGVAVWCQIGTWVARSISFLSASSVRPFPMGEKVCLAGCVLGSFRRESCGASSSCLAGLWWCVYGPVNLFLGSLSELLSFPNQFDQWRVLCRRGVCEEISCQSCQLRLGFSVAARVEASGVLDDLGLP